VYVQFQIETPVGIYLLYCMGEEALAPACEKVASLLKFTCSEIMTLSDNFVLSSISTAATINCICCELRLESLECG
jgi:hypothetical protein